jgi:hypothetical protein
MKALVVAIALLFAAGCAPQPVSTGKPASTDQPGNTGLVRYECYTYVDSKHVLTLPIPESDAATQLVQITLHGDRIPALYERSGLTQLWMLDDSQYIQLDPDFRARYMNFKGAKEGERRHAEAVFKCEKRK